MNGVVLLDGGMGQELIARSSQPPHPMWSAKVMLDEPDIVRSVHEDYLKAGATVLTLNTYSVTPERLANAGLEELFKPLQKAAIDLAKSAISETGVEALVAGCLPPLVASYRPDIALPYDDAKDIYRRIVAEQAGDVDFFLAETLSSVEEVRAATDAIVESGKPAWIAMSMRDGGSDLLRSGEKLSSGVAMAAERGAAAVMANCSWPETITTGLDTLAAPGLPYGAYANGFTSIDALLPGGTVDKLEARRDLDPQRYCQWAMTCIAHGASIIGGCCEVGPAHIAEIANQLSAAGYEITRDIHA